MNPTARIVADAALPDGEMRGFDADGEMIFSMRYMPIFERLTGTEDDERDVEAWHVSPEGVRRIAAIGVWNRMAGGDYPTAGKA